MQTNIFADAFEKAFAANGYDVQNYGLDREDDLPTKDGHFVTWLNQANKHLVSIELIVTNAGHLIEFVAVKRFTEQGNDSTVCIEDMPTQELPEQGQVLTVDEIAPLVAKYVDYNGPFDRIGY